MRRAVSLSIVALVALPVVGTGCVKQDNYDALMTTNRSLLEQNNQLTEQRDSARSNLDAAQTELARARTDVQKLERQNDSVTTEMDRIGQAYNDLFNRVQNLDVGLPLDVTMALEDLSRAYPEMVTFDAKRGMLRFSSDLTFALGSAELQGEAASTISRVADILNQGEARTLEVKVVGHTDNVPIGRPETRQKHPTNVHLSVHRAISVRSALAAAGVEPGRVQVAGYGEFRPIVPNGRKGAAENRRVEIFLTMNQTATTDASDMEEIKQIPSVGTSEIASEVPGK